MTCATRKLDIRDILHSRGNVVPLIPSLSLDQRQQQGVEKGLLYCVRPRAPIPESET